MQQRRPLLLTALLAVLLLATACTGGGSGSTSSSAGGAQGDSSLAGAGDLAAPAEPGAAAEGQASNQVGQAALTAAATAAGDIVRTANIDVRVSDRGAARQDALRTVTARGGFLADETSHSGPSAGGPGQPPPESDSGSSRLTLRVPVDAYSALLDDLSALGHVERLEQSSTDVTGTVVDVGSRIASQTASVVRVRALLSKAGDLGDVLKVEAELARREADLESLQARYAAVKDQASLSTVMLTLRSDEAITHVAGGGFLSGLTAGWHGFTSSARVAAVVLGAVLPFVVPLAVLLALILLVRRVLVRRQWRRRQPAAGSPAA